MMVLTTIVALLSGACNTGLLALVNAALTGADRPARAIIWAFAALGLGKVATYFLSQAMLARFSQGAIAQLRRDLIRKVLTVPLRQLEEIGAPRILVALTDDVMNITQCLLAIPLISVNLAILLGGGVYLAWLSWRIMAGMSLIVILGGIGFRMAVGSAMRRLDLARAEEDRLFGYFRALTEGLKELKLHRPRRNAFFFDNVQSTTEIFQRHNVAAELRFIAAQSWSHLLYFALIGLILFVLPAMASFSQRTLTGYVIAALYLMGPLAGVMGSFSLFGRANVALQKVQRLGVSLDAQSVESCLLAEPAPNDVALPRNRMNGQVSQDASRAASNGGHSFKSLELLGVVHSYHREQDDSHFVLGPIDLSFRAGELVFLIGGNGSGKSTLAKIISGLYIPEAGHVVLDGHPVTNQNRDDYRQLFSAVFGDFYLFENLLGLNAADLDQRAQQYLEQLHLKHKVRIRNGLFSTTAVSQGQRKRLALLTAYLEDRPFYLFDEWAADQDPYFKDVFYTRLLPELKARGKTVLVITHDDKYWHLADRILKLDYGKLAPEAGASEAPEGLHQDQSEPSFA